MVLAWFVLNPNVSELSGFRREGNAEHFPEEGILLQLVDRQRVWPIDQAHRFGWAGDFFECFSKKVTAYPNPRAATC